MRSWYSSVCLDTWTANMNNSVTCELPDCLHRPLLTLSLSCRVVVRHNQSWKLPLTPPSILCTVARDLVRVEQVRQ